MEEGCQRGVHRIRLINLDRTDSSESPDLGEERSKAHPHINKMWQIDETSLKPGALCSFHGVIGQSQAPFPFQTEGKCIFFVCLAEQTAPFEQTQVRGTVLAAFSSLLEGLTRCRVMKEMKPSKW